MHIRDLGQSCDEDKLSEHRFITLHRDAILELQDTLPLFVQSLVEFDETGDPDCLKKPRGSEKRKRRDDSPHSSDEASAEDQSADESYRSKKHVLKKKCK